jgi:ligand-binding SRPBCC domain-containing protein
MSTPSSSPIAITRVADHWRLRCAQWVPSPVAAVFPFFASARNLERLTPDFLHFRIRRAPETSLYAGALIDYRLRLHGVPVWWRTRIDEWTPGERFVDRQVRGPFRRWHHCHEFRTDGAGTLITDTVDFDLYCRWLFKTPALGWIESDLRSIFEHRRRQVTAIFGPEPPL